MPIIDYSCEIWTTVIDDGIFKKVKEFQIKYIREMYKLGKTSCIKAILLESSIQNINLRIHSRKEKFIWKNKVRKTPEKVWRPYEKRYDNFKYESSLQFDKARIQKKRVSLM